MAKQTWDKRWYVTRRLFDPEEESYIRSLLTRQPCSEKDQLLGNGETVYYDVSFMDGRTMRFFICGKTFVSGEDNRPLVHAELIDHDGTVLKRSRDVRAFFGPWSLETETERYSAGLHIY